jgi:hypothetical protein
MDYRRAESPGWQALHGDDLSADPGPRLCLLFRHADGQHEFEYDRDSRIGRLVDALDEARKSGWTIVDMQADWGHIYP